jgi:diguanylate cyclase (GGDEF)-like protein
MTNESPPGQTAAPAGIPRRPVTLRMLSLALTVVIGLGLTLTVFLVLLTAERSRLRSDFDSMAADRVQAIRSGLAEDYVELELVGSYITAANELGGDKLRLFAQEFGRFTSRVPDLEPDTVMIGYVARVTAARRKGFEAVGQAEIDPDFRILERGPAGDLVPAGDRPEYFVATVVEPLSIGVGVMGSDVASEPVLRDALETAIATGKIATSAVTDLPLPGSNLAIVWQFVPVYRRDTVPGVKPPRDALLGVAAEAFRVDLMVENSLKDLSPAGIDLELDDPAAPAGRQLLYYHRSRSPTGQGVPKDTSGWMSWTTTINAGGRTWNLTAYPTPGFLRRHRTLQPWIVLTGGLLLTGAAVAFFAGRLRRTLRIESLVQQRTHDLALEVEKHQRLEGALADSRATLAGQVARLNERSREILLLNEMGDTLQACLSTEEAYPVISLYLPRILPGTSGALYMHDTAGSLFVASAEWGDQRPAAAAFKAEDCWALRRGRMHLVTGSALALPCAHAAPQAGADTLCIPLAAIGRTIGLFHILGSDEDSRGLAQSVADRVGLSLSNLMLRSDLRQLSIHDPLTGLFNRRYMEETLEIETHRAERKGTAIGVIMLDIDHFKAFNDGFGHAAGDELLRAIAGLMQSRLRAGDIACRYGGEEFVLILPEAGTEAAAARAEDLRQRVKSLEVKSGETTLGPVTISAGVAVFPKDAAGRDALLAAADACLYRAKETGRDRVVVAAGKPRSASPPP